MGNWLGIGFSAWSRAKVPKGLLAPDIRFDNECHDAKPAPMLAGDLLNHRDTEAQRCLVIMGRDRSEAP